MDWNTHFAGVSKHPVCEPRLRCCPHHPAIVMLDYVEPAAVGFEVPDLESESDFGIADFEAIHKSSFGWEVLPDKKTPMTPQQVGAALSEGYRRVTGARPSRKILQLLLGQVALETGNFKSIHNFNFGNVKAKGSDKYVQYFRCSEIINGKEVFFDPPAPECRFVAFRTAADGAEHYIRTLRGRPHWWEGLQSKTVPGFIKGLTTPPVYFTANAKLYADVLQNRMSHYTDVAKEYAKKPATPYVIAAYLGAAGGYYWWRKRKKAQAA